MRGEKQERNPGQRSLTWTRQWLSVCFVTLVGIPGGWLGHRRLTSRHCVEDVSVSPRDLGFLYGPEGPNRGRGGRSDGISCVISSTSRRV